MAGLTEVFGEEIETYSTVEELCQKVDYYLEHPSQRQKKAHQAKELVLKNHTFDRRVEEMLSVIDRGREEVTGQDTPHNNILQLFYQNVDRLSNRGRELQSFLTELDRSEDGLKAQLTAPQTPLVSIIMPTFNRRYIIPEAIHSVLEQTYLNWEILICDDGSTDGTEMVVSQFEDARIQYFQLPKANGSVARNAGLKRAHGEYIAYLDSDNIWHPRHLQACLNFLTAQTEFKCAYTWAIDSEFKDGNWNLKGTYCQPFDYDKLIDRNYIDLNSFCHHRRVYETCGGFDESLLRLQDWDLVLRYLFAYPPGTIEYFTVFYRRNRAWKQVTQLYEKTNMRELVQQKAIANLGRNFIERISLI